MFDEQIPAVPAASQPHRALYLRWRPRRFEDVVGQEHVTRTLRNAVKLGRPSHAYLFTGPRGTGKTSVARILYRAVNCEHAQDGDPCNACALCRAALEGRALDLVEIDAASNRGIDDIRELRDKLAYRPGVGRYRLYIIDEAHELTQYAWDALLKTLEEPPPHALFVLATTAAHQVPPTIVSRCQRFDFRRIPYQATRQQLARVAESEGMQIEPAVLERLALVARGGLRDALSLLDQLSAFAVGEIDMAVARAALCLPSIEAVQGAIDGVTRRDAGSVMAVISEAAEGGADLRLFAEELVVHLRALLLLRTGADARLSDELPEDEVAWLRERAPAWTVGALMRLVQTLSEALARTRDAQQFQVQTEMALLAACDVEAAAAPPSAAAASPKAAPALAQPSPSPVSSVEGLPAESPPRETSPVSLGQGRAEPPRVAGLAGVAGLDTAPLAPGQGEGGQGGREAAEDGRSTGASARGLEGRPDLVTRWPDVVDHVRSRNPILASLLSSAQPIAIQDSVLIVAFGTDFNRKSAESKRHRQLIEAAFERVYGTAYRLQCTVGTAGDGGPSLLDDPVINYAARTFGGQPKRVSND